MNPKEMNDMILSSDAFNDLSISLSSHHKRIRNAVEEAFEKGWTPSDECDRSFRERILPALLYSDPGEVFGKGNVQLITLGPFQDSRGSRTACHDQPAKTGYWRLGQKLEQDRREWSNLLYDDSEQLQHYLNQFSPWSSPTIMSLSIIWLPPTSDNLTVFKRDESIGGATCCLIRKCYRGSLKRRGWRGWIEYVFEFLLHGFS